MKIKSSLLIIAIFAVMSQITNAAEFVDANENIPKSVTISSKELTRISIEGGSISNVKYMDSELDIQSENSNGQLYLRPIVSKPISLFITSERGRNYLLTLKPSKTKPADSIIIREGSTLDEIAERRNAQLKMEQERISRNDAVYSSAVQQFVQSMTASQSDNISCTPAGEEVPLWNEAMMIRKERCSTENLQGQVFTLTNVSNQQMVLAEQEFYKRNVIAVAIRQMVLMPGEQTDIYIVFGEE